MKIKLRYFILLIANLILSEISFSQINLVPNPSFEIHDSCPSYNSQFNKVTFWQGFQRSPDFFHSCASSWIASIPRNFAGFQMANSVQDSAYVGIGTGMGLLEVREVIGTRLIDSMIIGQRYYISFLVSAGYQSLNKCFCNKLGVKFITYIDSLTSSNSSTDLFNNTAHLYSDTIISDTTNWNLFRGSFIADSTYSGMLIGNFFTLDSIQSFCLGSAGPVAYHYIDNVCVSVDSATCFLIHSKIILVPNSDEVIFSNSGSHIKVLVSRVIPGMKGELYDMSGRLIWKREISELVTQIDIRGLSAGIYLLRIDNSIFKFIY